MIGDRIRTLRRKYGKTQLELGAKLKVTASAIVNWENGKRSPDGEVIKKIARIFNVTTDWLLFGNEDNVQVSLPNKENTITVIGRKGMMKTYTVDDAKFKEFLARAEELTKDK